MHRVFICHSSRDHDQACEIVGALESAAIPCWIAPRDPIPGIPYSEQIVAAVEQSTIVLLLLSADSDRSRAVLGEVELAANRNKVIVPVRLADVNPSPGLEYYIRSIHWHDVFGTARDAKIAALVARLAELLKVPGAPPVVQSNVRDWSLAPDREQRLTAEYTRFVGPIARVLIARAQQKARTIDELYDALAGEIENADERRRFRERCPSL